MLAALKAELRKLLTVRSTYAIIVISLAIIALFAGFGDGFRGSPSSLSSPGLLANESASAILFSGIILALAGLLLVGHEYRFNTIMYTIAGSNNRLKNLAAKFLVVSVFAVLMSTLVTFFSPLAAIVGAHIAGKHIGPQTFQAWSVLWHSVFCGWGYAMYAFIIVVIIRSQVGSIVTFLLVPLIGESIISSIFKWIGKYLPFNSIQAVAGSGASAHVAELHTSTTHSIVTASIYIVGGLLVSAILFVKRDAN